MKEALTFKKKRSILKKYNKFKASGLISLLMNATNRQSLHSFETQDIKMY